MDLSTLPEDAWREAVVNYLKEAMRAKGVDYPELARRLSAAGLEMDRVSLANRINRKGFTAAFLLQVMAALDERPEWLAQVAEHRPQDTKT
ncbi:DUF6471 domain-containing protein [Azospirillum soli]|uniref:DUF6471 domain-containing protein n=1 Tax=Azospirillum soli TaxID=1304799 RepID=UPI001AEA701B|nr:ribosomal protein L20 [Azospirillum soli]